MKKREAILVSEIENVCHNCGLAVSHGFGCPALIWIENARQIERDRREGDREQIDQEHRLWPEMDVDVPEEP